MTIRFQMMCFVNRLGSIYDAIHTFWSNEGALRSMWYRALACRTAIRLSVTGADCFLGRVILHVALSRINGHSPIGNESAWKTLRPTQLISNMCSIERSHRNMSRLCSGWYRLLSRLSIIALRTRWCTMHRIPWRRYSSWRDRKDPMWIEKIHCKTRGAKLL